MESAEILTDEQYSEELDGLRSSRFYSRATNEAIKLAEQGIVDLIAERLQQIIERDRSKLPNFLAMTRKILAVGSYNTTMNGNAYGELLEQAILRAFVPSDSSEQ